jgi:hypothetical protein
MPHFDDDDPKPADEQLLWILLAFVCFILGMMAIRSWLV